MARLPEVGEIIAWNSRAGRYPGRYQLITQIERLQDALESGTIEGPFLEFIPIRLVTILEVSAREAVKELVDFGSPYLDRANELLKSVKLDFAFVKSLHGQQLSVGDLAAHSISIGSLDSLLAALDPLLIDAKGKLITSRDQVAIRLHKQPSVPIFSDPEWIFGQLSRLFTVRHILTHEFPQMLPFHVSEIAGFLRASSKFVQALDWVVIDELKGQIPLTQSDMNEAAFHELGSAEGRMKSILEALRKPGLVDQTLLDGSQIAWQAFANAEAQLHASLVEGGSMQPQIYAGARLELTEQRIAQLKWWANREEGEIR